MVLEGLATGIMDSSKKPSKNEVEVDAAGVQSNENGAEANKRSFAKRLERGSKKSSGKIGKETSSASDKIDPQEIDLDEYTLAGGIKYKLPSMRLRLILTYTIFGLNALLLIVVLLFYKSEPFHDFIVNVGK